MTRPIVLIEQAAGLTVDYRAIPESASVEIVFLDWSEITPEEGVPTNDEYHFDTTIKGALDSIELLPLKEQQQPLTNILVWLEENEPYPPDGERDDSLTLAEREMWRNAGERVRRLIRLADGKLA